MTELKRYTVSRARTLDFLEGLSSFSTKNGASIYWPPAAPPVELEKQLIEIGNSPGISLEAGKLAAGSGTGAIFFRNDDISCLVTPPFPVPEKGVFGSIRTEGVRSLLNRDYFIALVLVRLGSYGIGVCRGEKLIARKVGTGLVHGRHRQGGSSAHRFERHRDKQIEYFMTRVCRHAREQIEPYLKSLDFIVYGGARTTVLTLQKQCDFLGKLDTPTLPPLFDIPDPRRSVLESALDRIWSSSIVEWRED